MYNISENIDKCRDRHIITFSKIMTVSLFTLVMALSIAKLNSLFAQEIPFIGYKFNKVMKGNYPMIETNCVGARDQPNDFTSGMSLLIRVPWIHVTFDFLSKRQRQLKLSCQEFSTMRRYN